MNVTPVAAWLHRDPRYAVVGGFHLTGALFESRISATIDTLKAIGPRYVMPGHCTGWAATHQIARVMPDAFIANSVGTTLLLRVVDAVLCTLGTDDLVGT